MPGRRGAPFLPNIKDRDCNLHSRCRGTAHLDQSALRRSLELAAKRRRGYRAEFFTKRLSFWFPASRLVGERAGLRWNGIPNFAVHRRDLLQTRRRPRMDRARSGDNFFRRFIAVFLFVRSEGFRQLSWYVVF